MCVKWLPKSFVKLSPYYQTNRQGLLFANKTVIGVGLAILSNVLFAVLYVYGAWLAPLTGTQVFVWRIVMMCLVIVAFIVLTGQVHLVKSDLLAMRNLRSRALFLLPTPILLSQLWLFVWAPLNGQALAVAMGYFLFPLVMVIIGFVVFGERLVRLQKLAVTLAAIGVSLEIIGVGKNQTANSLSWATFWVCGTFPIYYIMRKMQGIRAMTGLLVDTTVFLPIGLWYIISNPPMWVITQSGSFLLKTVGIGIISIMAFLANLHAIRLLSVSLFGILSYLEPLLLFVLAITLLGSPLTMSMLVNYGFIWAGVLCLLLYGTTKTNN